VPLISIVDYLANDTNKEVEKRIFLQKVIQCHQYTKGAFAGPKIGIEVAVRLCQQGGIVLVTTPITDTKKSFVRKH